MNWCESISRAIEYIENNLTNDITIEDISNYSYISSFYLFVKIILFHFCINSNIFN